MTAENVKIEESWRKALQSVFAAPYMSGIKDFLLKEQQEKQVFYPPNSLLFNAFNTTPFSHVKLVIIGQDPYHGEGQAHGLSFSVPKGVKTPPSLKNIYKELVNDADFTTPNHGDLTPWAEQGVLLLNAILSVRKGQPASHHAAGWEQFTDDVIKTISSQKEHVVFLLWGKFAQSKAALINEEKHMVLKAPHPSPFSAYTGFFGCKHFSKANTYLQEHGINPINWQI